MASMTIIKILIILSFIASIIYGGNMEYNGILNTKEDSEICGFDFCRFIKLLKEYGLTVLFIALMTTAISLVSIAIYALICCAYAICFNIPEVTRYETQEILDISDDTDVIDTFVTDTGKYYSYYIENEDGYIERVVPTDSTTVVNSNSNYIVTAITENIYPSWSVFQPEIIDTQYKMYLILE